MENEIKDKWNEIITYMRDTYNINGVLFLTWINPLTIVSCDNDTIILAIDEKEQGDILGLIEKKYKVAFQVSIEVITNHQLDVRFIYQNEMDAKGVSSYNKEEMLEEKYPFLKQGHSFDTFVVSNSNNIAYNAAVAVAENPNGQLYNPLFLYSGPGLGKTHLMHSIGHFILERNPNAKVLYVTSEEFTNEVIESIRSGNASAMNKLREKYRTIDVLMVDDVQFIIGKESTQEEFFHTFNALHSAGKQIILTSDKPPKDMETLEDRIRSRFEWGLIADIGTPDYETRMAILRRKVEADDMKLSDEILNYIATNIKSNIRELEGALNKLLAYSNLEKTDITMEIAMKELQNIITPDKPREITPQLVIEVVTEHFNISLDQMISKNRSNEIARPRQIAMYLCKNMTDIPLDSIGQLLGGRDHSTIIHGIKKIADEYESNENTRNLIETIKKKINPN